MEARYDDEIWRLVGDHEHPPPPHLAEFVRGLPPVERVLDLGCGDGRLTVLLQGGAITGADVSEVALERARGRVSEGDLVRIEPGAPLPFDDNAFELVLCTETLEHVRDIQLFLSEVRRVLTPGGTLALTTPSHAGWMRTPDPLSPHIRFFTRRSLRDLLGQLGFEVRSLTRRRRTLFALAER